MAEATPAITPTVGETVVNNPKAKNYKLWGAILVVLLLGGFAVWQMKKNNQLKKDLEATRKELEKKPAPTQSSSLTPAKEDPSTQTKEPPSTDKPV